VLEPDEWTDGDSFRVRLPDSRLETFRLYFVDTTESRSRGKRSDEQAAYFGLTIESTESPKAWLKSGALVIAVDTSWITEDGGGSCSQTVTIAFDANRKAFVQSVTDKKVD
jgi:endonuclease YncB( thermonuclease family)